MLKTRATGEELMDADDLDPDVYAAVVHDLAKVNSWTLARRPTLAFVERVMARRERSADPLRILDVGFGDGDMLRAIHARATAEHWDVELTGVDLNPRSAPAAMAATTTEMTIEWITGDYGDLAGRGWDVVVSSLVAHHMTRAQLIAFLQFMDRAAKAGWFVNDLHRHGVAYLGFPILARAMRWHPIVRHDGTLSVARSFRRDDWDDILAEAHVEGAFIERRFPFRLCVSKIR